MKGNELGNDFGVRVTLEDNSVGQELPFEGRIVLDDAVVDDRDQAIAAEVGVGVAIGCGAVCGPACMADAAGARGGLVAEVANEALDAPSFFAKVQVCSGD